MSIRWISDEDLNVFNTKSARSGSGDLSMLAGVLNEVLQIWQAKYLGLLYVVWGNKR